MSPFRSLLQAVLPVILLLSVGVFGQASYTAQIRGIVTDQTGAVVPNATVTITNDATNISLTTHSDDRGQYVLSGLRPATYTIKAEGSSFRAVENKNVVLQVDQQTTINFELRPSGTTTTVEVTSRSAPAGYGECLRRHRCHQRICARRPTL